MLDLLVRSQAVLSITCVECCMSEASQLASVTVQGPWPLRLPAEARSGDTQMRKLSWVADMLMLNTVCKPRLPRDDRHCHMMLCAEVKHVLTVSWQHVRYSPCACCQYFLENSTVCSLGCLCFPTKQQLLRGKPAVNKTGCRNSSSGVNAVSARLSLLSMHVAVCELMQVETWEDQYASGKHHSTILSALQSVPHLLLRVCWGDEAPKRRS